jgi:hypothetical protein
VALVYIVIGAGIISGLDREGNLIRYKLIPSRPFVLYSPILAFYT